MFVSSSSTLLSDPHRWPYHWLSQVDVDASRAHAIRSNARPPSGHSFIKQLENSFSSSASPHFLPHRTSSSFWVSTTAIQLHLFTTCWCVDLTLASMTKTVHNMLSHPRCPTVCALPRGTLRGIVRPITRHPQPVHHPSWIQASP